MQSSGRASARFARPDYYQLLQVSPGAHPEVVRAAYRTLLRVLGKHPDLGGTDRDAQLIIDAYQTLSDPERRRAYDLWLRAHSAAAPRGPVLPSEVAAWLRTTLPDYRDAPDAPFADRFDLVLASAGPFTIRVYVKAYATLLRAHWPSVLTLSRAIRLARSALVPSTDVVLLVAAHVQDQDRLLAETVRQEGAWAWNRAVVAVLALEPRHIHTGRIMLPPEPLQRLRAAAT